MPFRKVPNYIVKARASYLLVRGVPSDCQAKVGKKKWKEGGGKTVNEARARLPGFLARTDLLIAEARGEQLSNEERVIQQGDHQGGGFRETDLAEPQMRPLDQPNVYSLQSGLNGTHE